MVLADLGRKITTALHSLSKAVVINEEVREFGCRGKISSSSLVSVKQNLVLLLFYSGSQFNAKRNLCCFIGSRC